jgi:hypothetical protein
MSPISEPVLFRDRSRAAQLVLAGVVPAAIGALAGVLLGVSAGAYWAVGALAAVGGFLAGFEHLGAGEAAKRGLIAGAIYGIALLVAHEIAGTEEKVSLGELPPFLVVITAVAGALIAAAGARVARGVRA